MKHNIEQVVFVDFETYYSSEFSLTKQQYNTSSYIRNPQFLIHCVAVKVGTQPTRCFTDLEGEAFLKTIDWSTHALCAHNCSFDGFILSHWYGIIPSYYYDTVSMTRGLHNEVSRASLAKIAEFYKIGEKSKTYLSPTKNLRALPPNIMQGLMDGCILDVDLCYEVFLKQVEIYPQHELDLIDMTIGMFCDSVLEVDIPVAKQAYADEMVERRATILKSNVDEKDLMSNPKFAKLLEALGVEPPMKVSNTTGMETYAFAQSDAGFTELLEHENKAVVILAQARLAAKSTQAETRANRLLEAGADGQKLPVGYNYYGAKTGRWSGSNKLNLQNLPRVNPYEPKPSDGLRRSIIAPKDHVLVVTDSAQIEARINAWLCSQKDVVEQFANKEDVYRIMAARIFRKPLDAITKDERFIGKICVLGLGYSMGPAKFQTTLAMGIMGPAVDILLSEATRIVKLYRTSNSYIVDAWKILDGVLKEMMRGGEGEVFNGVITYDAMSLWLPNGLGLHYPGLHVDDKGQMVYRANDMWKKVYGGLLLENIVQALARIAVGEQMLMTQDALRKLKLKKDEVARVVLMTHDEIVSAVPERLAEKHFQNQLDIMRTPPHNWGADIPFDAEGGWAFNYSK